MTQALVARRVQIAILFVAILFVPALTRATQHLTSTSTSHESSGFSRGADAAPERVTVSPDLQAFAFDVASIAAVPASQPAWTMQRVDQPVPSSIPIPTPRPLRAPPSFPLL
jgi:hypothetical protein